MQLAFSETVALLLFLVSPLALADIQLCLHLSDPTSAQALATELKKANISLVDSKGCPKKPGPRRYLGTFSHNNRGQVRFVLKAQSGHYDRVVPWLAETGDPLTQLQSQNVVPRFALLVEGLIAEERFTRLSFAHRAAAAKKKSRRPQRKTGAVTSSVPAAPTTAQSAPQSIKSAVVQSRPAQSRPVETKPTQQPKQPRVVLAIPDPVEPDLQPQLETQFGVGTAARFRTPNFVGAQWQARFVLHGFFIGFELQLPRQWSLQGRPIEMLAAGGSIGWSPVLVNQGDVQAGVLGGLCAENITLQRLDIEGASGHSFWDAGLLGGLFASFDPFSMLRLRISLEGIWMPLSRKVQIAKGPETEFNTFGLRLGISGAYVIKFPLPSH